jgi:adenosylcobinamide-GDP ribazoletransferase
MIRQAQLFFSALQLMTRLPTPRIPDFEPDWISRSAPYFPVVGWIVGAICAVVMLSASRLWPGLPAAIIAVGAAFLVTGGFHEDGLADTADGLGGGQSPAQRLEIMKDSRIGSYGVLAVWTVLSLKVAVLGGLPPLRAAVALILAHGLARAFAVAVMAGLAYAGDLEAAKLKPAPMSVRPVEALMAVALGLAPLLFFLPALNLLLGLVLAACAVGALAILSKRLIGGFTGDVLGAVEQLAEAGLLLGFAAKGMSMGV